MKSIADFKRKMIKGSKWETIRRFKDKPETTMDVRECVLVQSNSFGLNTVTKTGETRTSYCDWPKKSEATFIDENTIKIDFGYGELIYKWVS